jgi:predicted RNA-binding protein associated with RNAse of E/G family
MKIDRKQLALNLVDTLCSWRTFITSLDKVGMGEAFVDVPGFSDVHAKLEDLIFDLLCVPADNTTEEPASSLMDLANSGQMTNEEFEKAWDASGCFCRDCYSDILYDISNGEKTFDVLWDETAEFRTGDE